MQAAALRSTARLSRWQRGCRVRGAGGAELLKRKERPTAVFAANDTLAIGSSMRRTDWAERAEDLSVIGIDGTPLGLYIYPKLTSVSHPRFQIGKSRSSLLSIKSTETPRISTSR
ncbi:substrate-binding domain-containing protein [Cohnella faecalis]|uniref:substrate-binding domain-containing protein n=1 Tax=Cohnella faecalis TaxID=2315694 RepID=UPI0013149DCF